MSNETQPTFPKAREFSAQPAALKRTSLFSDFAKRVFSPAGAKADSISWRQRIFRFFNPVEEKKHYYTKHEAPKKTIAPCLPSMRVSQNEADAFRMKAITLMKSQGIPFDFRALRNIPILANEASANTPILSCYQILSPFPGEIIELKGSFKRNGIKDSTPIPDSFQLLPCRSQQSGFPHPSQHNGWALDKCLVEHPMTSEEILHRKLFLAKELMPNGTLLERAKEHLKQKRYGMVCSELIALHRQLAHAIVGSNVAIINDFFDRLSTVPNVYDTISAVYEQINQAVFYDKAIVSEHAFAKCMKEAILPGVKRILSNEGLTPFDQKLQLATYKQVREFMTDIDLRTQLESDIALFNS